MGTAYGDEIIFTALSGMSTLTTAEVTEVTDSQAKTGGNITDDGGLEITVRGVCWSTKPAPTVNDNKTDDGRGTGTFTSIISGL